jgi:hypothetical protein
LAQALNSNAAAQAADSCLSPKRAGFTLSSGDKLFIFSNRVGNYFKNQKKRTANLSMLIINARATPLPSMVRARASKWSIPSPDRYSASKNNAYPLSCLQ